MRFLLVGLFLLSSCAHEQRAPVEEHPHGEHHFDDPAKWASVWDDPARDEWQKPSEVIAALQLKPDDTVADIGAGTGYFTVRLAYAVPKGRVYGVDVEASMVRYLEQRAAAMQLSNVQGVVAGADDPRIPEPVDLILIVNTYHHLEAREGYFRKLQASLKPHGRIALIDFTKEAPMGPPVRERFAVGEINSEMEVAGYKLVANPKFLPFQNFLIFEPLAK